MPIVKTLASDSLGEALASLVEQLIAVEPFKTGGFDWAAQPQSYYCEKLSVSPATLRRRISKPPFVRAWKIVGAQIETDGEDTTIVGGKKFCVLRIGVAPPKDVADEAKRVMITIWNKVQAKPVTKHQAQCLWGMTKDIMELLNTLSLLRQSPGQRASLSRTHRCRRRGTSRLRTSPRFCPLPPTQEYDHRLRPAALSGGHSAQAGSPA
jgi:hypothetical protein